MRRLRRKSPTNPTAPSHRAAPARRAAATGLAGALALTLAACGGGSEKESAETGTLATAAPSSSAPAGPEVPQSEPVDPGPCPYLTADDVQRLELTTVADVRTDRRIDPPACFFLDGDGRPQVSVAVYTVGSPEDARTLVSQSVPTDGDKALHVPGGWDGGAPSSAAGALVAVAKENRLLVVNTVKDDPGQAQGLAELVALGVH